MKMHPVMELFGVVLFTAALTGAGMAWFLRPEGWNYSHTWGAYTAGCLFGYAVLIVVVVAYEVLGEELKKKGRRARTT